MSEPVRPEDQTRFFAIVREILLQDCLATLQEIRDNTRTGLPCGGRTQEQFDRDLLHNCARLAVQQIEALEKAGVPSRKDGEDDRIVTRQCLECHKEIEVRQYPVCGVWHTYWEDELCPECKDKEQP